MRNSRPPFVQTHCSNHHHWTPQEIESLAQSLGKTNRIRKGWTCLCPAHGDHNPSLSLSLGKDGQLLAHCHAGCDFKDIMKEIQKRGLLKEGKEFRYLPYTPPKAPNPPKVLHRQKNHLPLWMMSLKAERTPVEKYLRSRGYMGKIPSTLRFHPAAYHGPTQTKYPCILGAVMRWPNKIIGVHRTFIKRDGRKADISPNKMMLGET